MLFFPDQYKTLHRVIYTNYTLLGTLMVYWMSILLLIFDNVWISNFLFLWRHMLKQKHVVVVFFSDFNTQISIIQFLTPPILLIPTSKDVFYPTHRAYISGFLFHLSFSLLSTLLYFASQNLRFGHFLGQIISIIYLARPYPLMNYLWAIRTLRIVYYNW